MLAHFEGDSPHRVPSRLLLRCTVISDTDKEEAVTARVLAASPELMIDVTQPVGTSDLWVLDVIRAVPRHSFVPGVSQPG